MYIHSRGPVGSFHQAYPSWFFFRIFHSQTGHNSLGMSEVIVSIINEDLGIEEGESNQRNQCSGKKSKPHAIVGHVAVRPSVPSVSAN